MKVVYADEFSKQFKKLPLEAQRIFYKQEKLFKVNWRDSRLHIKKLREHELSFSFRITRRYRVLFIFISEDLALFATIGHRKDIYK
ncbi:MAG: type II toxin-antitoxin system RelE/ParE family toxin [bacterium]|nr:type II toxin-antitoxin system RelE/ParE family toxin [bacterium]